MLPCPEDLIPPMLPSVSLPAAIAWTVIILGVLAFELWAMHHHRNTLSQFVQHKPRWFRWLAEIGVIYLGFHLMGLA